jgi:AcrR family transcriptional regulator
LEDIGKVTQMNKATLYYYFKNKEEIFIAVVLAESEKFIAALQTKVAAHAVFQDKITNYFSERLHYYKKMVNLHQLSVAALRYIQPIFDELYQKVQQTEINFLSEILQAAKQQGSIKTEQPLQEVAEAIILVANALKHEAVMQSKEIYAHEIDYTAIDKKTNYIILLILKGLQA